MLVDSLKTADRKLHTDILRMRVFNQKDLPPALAEDLAAEIIPLLHGQEDPDLLEHASFVLERLGEPAAKGLFELVKAHPAAPEADHAVRSLARIIAQKPAGSPVAHYAKPALDFAAKRVGQQQNRIGGYAYAMGVVAATGLAGEAAAQRALEQLVESLSHVPYPADAVFAISRLAASELITPSQRVNAVHLLTGLVDRPAETEETAMRQMETDKGPVYEVTGYVEFDSDTLPAAVQGMADIAVASSATEALREQIAETFLRVWVEVALWKTVWGPRSAERLAQSLGRVAADERIDPQLRNRVLKGLALALERLSVVRALETFFAVSCDRKDFNDEVLATADAMLNHWLEPEIAPEELEAVLRTAANAAARPEISSRTKRARRLRQRVAELLFDALRNGMAWPRKPLEKMRDCKRMPKALRREIDDRLKLAFSVRGI